MSSDAEDAAQNADKLISFLMAEMGPVQAMAALLIAVGAVARMSEPTPGKNKKMPDSAGYKHHSRMLFNAGYESAAIAAAADKAGQS